MKSGAAIGLTFGPRAPAMAGDDASYIGKADTIARELGSAVQALEHAKQLARVLHVETRAVVAHGEFIVASGRAVEAYLDLRLLTVTGVLHGVAEQVLP